MSEEMLPVEADLTLLRSQLPKKRRRHRRQRCNLATMAKVVLPAAPEPRVTWVYNLSLGGVGLNSPEALEAGQSIIIHFRAGDQPVAPIAARVVFSQAEVDRTWRIGCEFATPIDDDLLEKLLG